MWTEDERFAGVSGEAGKVEGDYPVTGVYEVY